MSDTVNTWPPRAPSLPAPHRCAIRGSEAWTEIKLSLEVITPIFGGSPIPRKVDNFEVIRAASIRGQLRFWWRALCAHAFDRATDLYEAERKLWGGPTTTNSGGRSPVEIRVEVTMRKGVDTRTPSLGSPDGYALFPARAPRGKGDERGQTAERYEPGTRFNLIVLAPASAGEAIRAAIRAWVLFGGYGGRTRRGLGSLTVTSDRKHWLPERATEDAFERLFGRDIFAPAKSGPTSTPVLAGAEFFPGAVSRASHEAWTTAVSWLQAFRQGQDGPNPARDRGSDDSRPGRSKWPEADKVRRLSILPRGVDWAHPPRHNHVPAWPRATLGLPIIGQFQRLTRKNQGNKRWEECEPKKTEPRDFEIGWLKDGKPHDRLASPLIVKPLPLADGSYAPFALWLARARPPGKVVLKFTGKTKVEERSAAEFDTLIAAGDEPAFASLKAGQDHGLRGVFFAWLRAHSAHHSKRSSALPSPSANNRHDRAPRRRT